MRTSSIVSYTALFASSGALALSFAAPESFDNLLLRARAALPDVVPMHSAPLVKRAEGPWDCSEDEEYVAYEEDDEDDDDTPVFEPAKQQGQVKAVQQEAPKKQEEAPKQEPEPAPAPAPKKQEQQKQETSTTQAKTSSNNNKSAPAPAPMPSPITTPENIADGTYTADEGCARYYQVQVGDVCLKLVEDNKDLGLTLDQLYCLNPAIDDLCYNLWIGTSYCVGYSGEEPLNTGVASKAS